MTVKNEAIWALSNCTACASPPQYQQLVQRGIIKALGLTLKVKDVRMLAVAMEGLENVLECGENNFKNEKGDNQFVLVFEQLGFIDDLEMLQEHKNHSIYKTALKLIDKYFPEEEEDGLIKELSMAA